jgi:pimeloyl-ACP methyl ester carboxylesterase
MHKVERRYISVEGRRVHYRRQGEGPPAVLLHASPANSEMVLAEMAAAAPRFTCFAFDTPGFGESQKLDGDTLTVTDLAAATAASMAALDLPPCPVFGTHTGSAIALELGVLAPDRVTGLVLDAVPLFTEAEMASIFQDFFVTFPADPLGAHLTSTWMRFRDQFTWFPWKARHVSRLNPVDRPSPADIQFWVMMYSRARKTYMPAYRAACFWGQRGVAAAEALRVPAVFMATEEDMLFGHLDRLPSLRDNQRVVRLPYDTAAKHQAIVGFLREFAGPAAVPIARPQQPVGRDPAVQFIDTQDGQVFIRCYGERSKPAVILLHDAPGTGLLLDGLARGLAGAAFVIVPDLPGTGESEAPEADRPILEASADAVGCIADALGVEQFALAAIGCGAAVAASFANRPDPRLTELLLEDVPRPDEAAAQQIAPPIPLTPEGTHWLQTWLMVRDQQIYRPWFDGTIAAQRKTQGNFDAEWLHDQTFALMKSRETYHLLPQAAFRFDSAASLATARVPVRIAPSGGLGDLILSALG